MNEEPQAEPGRSPETEPSRSPETEPRGGGIRPTVTVPSLLGAAAGILLLGSLSGFLSELSGERLRIGGLLLSLMFEALGVVLLVVSRGRRSSTAGVTLAALGTIPLVFFTFFDVQNGSTLVGGEDVALTSTIALLVAAALWFAGHLFGPSRSHVLFLGAALVAVWLAITIQVVDEPAQPRFDRFDRPAVELPTALRGRSPGIVPVQSDAELDARIEQFEKYEDGEVVCVDDILVEGDPTYWSCDGDFAYFQANDIDDDAFDDEFQFDDDPFDEGLQFEDDFGPGFDDEFQFDEYYDDEDLLDVNFYGTTWGGTVSRFGWSTLAFGLVYLGAGRLFDRAGDTRRGTAFFAVATPLSYYGASFVDIDALWMRGVLFLLIGAAAVWAGAQQNRRFTAWSGTLIATGGLATVVIDVVGDDASGTTYGFTFLVVGLAVAAGAHLLEGGRGLSAPGTTSAPGPAGPGGPLEQAGPTTPPSDPAWAPATTPSDQAWAPAEPTPPAPPPDQAWAPRPTWESPDAPPPPFDPRPPGSDDPLPTDPEPPSHR